MVWIVVAAGVVFTLLMVFAMCRAAVLGDRQLDALAAQRHQQASSHREG